MLASLAGNSLYSTQIKKNGVKTIAAIEAIARIWDEIFFLVSIVDTSISKMESKSKI